MSLFGKLLPRALRVFQTLQNIYTVCLLVSLAKCSWEFDLSDVSKVVQHYHRYTYEHFVRDFMKIAVGC